MSKVSIAAQPGIAEAADRDWAVVAASAVGLILSLGTLLLYTFGVFAGPLTREFGWTRTQASGALAVSQYTFALCAPAWGLLIDRFGPRPVVVFSVFGMSTVVASLSLLTPNLWHYYLAFAAASFLAGAASPIGYSAVIVRKFERHLGLALGLALMGVGIGAATLPPLAQFLVTRLGWREAFAVLGALTLAVTLPAALVATRGARGPALRAAASGHAERKPLLSFIGTRAFVVMCVIFLLLGIISIGGLANLVPIMVSRGFSPAEAAQVAGMTGIATIAGRGGIGFVLDRVYAPFVVCAISLLAMASFLLIAYSTGVAPAYLAAALLGMVVGAEVDFTAFFVRRYFGRDTFGQLYGLTFGVFIVGSGTGPVLMSASFDRFGTYQAGALLFAAASAAVALLTFAMPAYAAPGSRAGGPAPTASIHAKHRGAATPET